MCERAGPVLVLFALTVLSTSGAAERRDPLRPPDHRPATLLQLAPIADPAFDPQAWTLSSTLVSSQRRVAIINGLAVRTGEQVAGARVLGIEPDLVRLEIEGRSFTVRRTPTRVRRTPRGQNR